MLCLSGDFVYIYVKRWLGAGKQLDLCKCCACHGTSANAVPVTGFRVHLRETLAGCRSAAGPLQMLSLSGDFVYIYVKRWLGAGKQLDFCKCYACQGISCAST